MKNDNDTPKTLSSDEWETTEEIFELLNKFYKFDRDVCATSKNKKCKLFYSKKINGLRKKWNGKCFCNPPYSSGNIIKWVIKAIEEIMENKNCEAIVMLLPVDTSTKYFKLIWEYANAFLFINKRIKFLTNGTEKTTARFPSVLIIFDQQLEDPLNELRLKLYTEFNIYKDAGKLIFNS